MKRNYQCLLVTGGAGFIGSAFIRHLLLKEDFSGTLINLDALTYAGNEENVSCIQEDSRYVFIKGDITDNKLLEELIATYPVDLIVHFAAESHVDRSILSPMDFVHTNILGTLTLLELLRKNPHIHMHHISTDEVFGSLDNEGLFTEKSPYQPNSPYSASKASSDHFVRAYAHTYGIKTTLSNCSNNYGPYQFPEKLIPLIFSKCRSLEAIPVYGDGLNIRDWLYVEDHIKAIWQIITRASFSSSYNIGGNTEKTNLEIVNYCLKTYSLLTGQSLKELKDLITFVSDRPGHDFRYAINSSKIQKDLHWKPEHSFEKGLEKTFSWYLENESWMKKLQATTGVE